MSSTTAAQFEHFDQWSVYYELHRNWKASQPQNDVLFKSATEKVPRDQPHDFYIGYNDGLAHILLVSQKVLETAQRAEQTHANKTQAKDAECNLREALACFTDYMSVLATCIDHVAKQKSLPNLGYKRGLYEFAMNAIAQNKSEAYYRGFSVACTMAGRVASNLYAPQSLFIKQTQGECNSRAYCTLVNIVALQSNFAVGLMLDVWPSDQMPTLSTLKPTV